jgi:hypothetical protein
MNGQGFGSRDGAGPARRRWYPGLLSGVLIAPICAHAGQPTAGDQAAAQPPAPQVQQQDVRSLSEEAPVKRWKEGEPVRIVPDLREGGTGEEPTAQPPPQPTVRAPVPPQVMKRSVSELPKVQPYREGEPVRIVPDLKESEPQ